MAHCYIFDFTDGQIYHLELPEDIADDNDKIKAFLKRNYGLKETQISFMITEHKRSIIEI